MIGFIITGHGNYATGLLSAINLILGNPKNVVAVDFLESDSSDELKNNIETAIKEMNVEGYVIYSDLLGGSPFKVSVELSQKYDNIKVLAGTNVAMVAENIFLRESNNESEIAEKSLDVGKNAIDKYELRVKDQNIDEEGI
jgi:PTS system N-acetylgalactosamine-specific IIA component